MDKILVTGGAGFIGFNLVHRLLQEGYTVRVLDNGFRDNLKKITNFLDDIEFMPGDVRNADDVNRACNGMDTIFHLACINGTRYFYEIPETLLEVSTKGIINAVEAAIRHNIQKFILASSSEVYHEPIVIPTPESHPAIIPDMKNPRFSYSGGKIISELWVLHYGKRGYFQPLIFRPYNIYGPDMGDEHVIPEFIQRIRRLSREAKNHSVEMPIQGSGQETRSFCYIQDFIDGLLIMASHGESGEIYNIGNDMEETKISLLAETIASILSIDIRLISTPLQNGSSLRRCPDIGKLRSLGFSPRITLKEGLRQTVEWYLQHE